MSETDLTTIPNIGPTKAAALKAAGFETTDEVKEASIEDLCVVDGIARQTAEEIVDDVPRDTGKFEEVREDLLEAAELTLPSHQVANLAGVTQSTLYNYLNEHEDFAREYRKRRSRAALSQVQQTERTEDNAKSRAGTFMLERVFGFTKTEKHEVEMDADINSEKDINLDDESKEIGREILAERYRGDDNE